jgi:hypothetical protein
VFDAVSVQGVITDSTGNISIFDKNVGKTSYFFNFMIAPGQGSPQGQIPGFQADSYPLAKNLYWYLSVDTQVDFAGGNIDFSINNTQVLFDTLPAGPNTGLLFDWTTNTNPGLTNASGCDLEFEIT